MQASIYFPSSSPFLSLPSAKPSSFSKPLFYPTRSERQFGQASTSLPVIKAQTSENSQIDYNSMASSVFPAEACETVGGVACDVDMFPETKIKQQPDPKRDPPPTSQPIDREYLEYNSSKTVFIAEACDDLGGEFCEPAYQSGVN